MLCHLLQGARFFEEVRGAADDDELLFAGQGVLQVIRHQSCTPLRVTEKLVGASEVDGGYV